MVKWKASTTLSTVQRKKMKHVPKGDGSDASSVTVDPDVDLTRKQQPSVMEIDDDSDADSKFSISNNVEDSDDELCKQPELDIWQ